MSWKTNDSGITVPDWWDPKFPWRESCVYLPREVDLEGKTGGWIWRVKIDSDVNGNFVFTITGILGDVWVHPEESELVSEWSERCQRIVEMYSTAARAVFGEVGVSKLYDVAPEDWYQNGPGSWLEGQVDIERDS